MTTVIYHSADFDGIFCREIAKQFYKDKASYVGWNFGDSVPAVAPDEELVILDLSIEPLMAHPHLLWIDHHATALAKYPFSIRGHRLDGVAACRLAYQWFHNNATPFKVEYVERTVIEPLAVRLAGEYDIWDKRDPNADLFQYALRCIEPLEWGRLLELGAWGTRYTAGLLSSAQPVQKYAHLENASLATKKSFDLTFEGVNFMALNTARCNSLTFTAGLKDHHDGCLGFFHNGKHWTVSLYGVPSKPDVDLSKIAVKHGGGGHKQACGFTCKSLPFEL